MLVDELGKNVSGGILCALVLVIVIAGCAQQPDRNSGAQPVEVTLDNDAAEGALPSLGRQPPEEDTKPVLPAQELTDVILYEFLLAEIAGQRGNVGLSAQAYFDLAKRTRDPRIARRATEIAIFARMNNIALEAARIWYETDPRSPRAAQVLAGLLLGTGQLEEAYPHLRSMLAMPGANPAETFLQLVRSLANVKDKAASLQLMQRLVTDHAALPQARFAVAQEKRGTLEMALDHLAEHAPARPPAIELPAAAPFGTIDVNKDRCTLCLSCVSACPAGALQDNALLPQLRFIEKNCVQCGLCATTCPEKAITLQARLLLTPERKEARVLNETQPYACVRCGKPFGTLKAIEAMLGKLAGHSMFQGAALERLKMCADCRVIDIYSATDEVKITDIEQ